MRRVPSILYKTLAVTLVLLTGVTAVLLLPSLAGAMPAGTGRNALPALHYWIRVQGLVWMAYLVLVGLLATTRAVTANRLAHTSVKTFVLVLLVCTPQISVLAIENYSIRQTLHAVTTFSGLLLWLDLLRRTLGDLRNIFVR